MIVNAISNGLSSSNISIRNKWDILIDLLIDTV